LRLLVVVSFLDNLHQKTIAIRERDDYSPGPSCEPFRAKFATENKLFEATMLASAL